MTTALLLPVKRYRYALMGNFFLCIQCILLVALYGQAHAASRYWVGASTYLNNFSVVTDLNQWVLTDDNGTGSWSLSGNGTGILRIDNAVGGFSNRLFNVNGSLPNYLPLDNVNGVVSFQVLALTGGTQRFYLQAEEYNAGGILLNQQTIISPASAVGSYRVNLSSITWNAATTQIRLILVADNQSGQQGTVEFNYFNYSSSFNSWNSTASWSDSPGGLGGVSVPGAADQVFFDGSNGFNAPCVLSSSVTVGGISLVGYTGTIDLRGFNLTSTGSNTFNTGDIANANGSGALFFNSTGITTFAGTSLYTAISGSCRAFFFNGSYFNNPVTLTKTGPTTDTGSGGNIFQSTVTLTNNSSGSWRFANVLPDIFNGPLTLNVGLDPGASIELANASTGNQFNDNITINYNTPGVVNFGGAAGTSGLAAGKILTVATCAGGNCGSLSLSGIDIAAPQTITFPGAGTGTFRTALASAWHGDLAVTAASVFLDGATFHGVTMITKTGTSVDESRGGNFFRGSTTITNAGTGTLRMAVTDGDAFEAPVVFGRAGGSLEPAYNGSSSFTADVTTNSASSIIFGGGNGLVIFTGADAQTLGCATGTAAPTIQRLVMDKSSNMLTLNTPVTVGVSANFLAGIIAAATPNYVGFGSGATVSNAKNASHVDGVVKKNGNADFDFPVGDDGIYRPITITGVSNNSVFAAQFFKTPQLFGSARVGTLATLSSCEYWMLDRESGLGTPYVTLSWRSSDCSASLYVSAPADLRLAHWNGAFWDDYGASGYTGDNAQGTVTTGLPVLSFSPFVLASATPNNPLTVLKSITITVNAGQSKSYGDVEPALTYSLSAPLDGSDVFTGQLARATGEDAGAYPITQGTLDAGSNYQLSFVGDDFTIIPKAITITANAGQSRFYGAAEPVLTYSLSAPLVGTDALTGALARTGSEDAGTYPITQGTLDAGSNYQLSFAGDDFTILPRAVTIAANARTKVYGEADPVLTYTLTPPLVPGDNMAGALTRDPGEAAGTYTIHQGTLDAGSNYAVTFQEAALVITRQQQSIVFNDLPEKAEGDQPFTITATASSGLPVTFTSSDENMATVANNTVTISGVGTVIITAHQDGNERFDPAPPVSRDLVVRGSGLFVPNLFSPDGNGANDTFIVHAAGVREIQLVIYNSLGQEVFRTTDIDTATRTGWNGRKGNEEQPAGMYAWSLQGRWSNGDPIAFQGKNHGQVILIR
jgi:hypothetical protein